MGRKYCRADGRTADDSCADRRAAVSITAVISITSVISITAITPVNSASIDAVNSASDAAVIDCFNLCAGS